MLRLRIGRSPRLALLLGTLHAAALGLALTVPMPLWGRVLLCLALAASALHAVLLHAWQALPRSIVGLEISDECSASVMDRAGGWHAVRLAPSSFVTPWLTVLNFRPEGGGGARSLVIVPDRIDPDPYRRLRVLLRWRCRDGSEEETPPL